MPTLMYAKGVTALVPDSKVEEYERKGFSQTKPKPKVKAKKPKQPVSSTSPAKEDN